LIYVDRWLKALSDDDGDARLPNLHEPRTHSNLQFGRNRCDGLAPDSLIRTGIP
jgi:hypothetical protein